MLDLRGVWTIEPWSGALGLNLAVAFDMLDRFGPGYDIEIMGALLSSFEAGAVKGWAKVLAQRKAAKT